MWAYDDVAAWLYIRTGPDRQWQAYVHWKPAWNSQNCSSLETRILPIISQVRTSLVNRFREGQPDQILPGFLFVHYFANQSDSDGGKRKRPELRKKWNGRNMWEPTTLGYPQTGFWKMVDDWLLHDTAWLNGATYCNPLERPFTKQ